MTREYVEAMATRKIVGAVAASMLLGLGLPGVAHAAIGTIAATAPTAAAATCTNAKCSTKFAAAVTINASTSAQTIQVTLTLCKGTSTGSCVAVVSNTQTFSVAKSSKATSLAPSYTYTCKTSGTASFFTKAVVTNGTVSGLVTAYSTPKSQKGCVT